MRSPNHLAFENRRDLHVVTFFQPSFPCSSLSPPPRRFEDNVVQSLYNWGASERLVTSTSRPPRTAEVTIIDVEKAAATTLELMGDDSGIDTILQPTFLHGDLVARGDVVRRGDDGGWEIVEIKSSLDKSHRKKVPDIGEALA